MIYLIITAAALIILAAVILIRTLLFKPERKLKTNPQKHFVDASVAAASLSEMIKCKTVSCVDKNQEDETEFEKFKSLLPELFPDVYIKCENINIGKRSILLKWSGKSKAAPTVFMAHYDVVSADEEKWQKPPFGGIMENGVLWGRGAIDTKVTLNAILTAAQMLIKDGFVPSNDIYFAFAGDEEISGSGASDIVSYFKENSISPYLVLDEGGAVVENVFPGVKSPCALVGIAEKGMINIEYSVSGGGGHASSPSRITPIGRLSRACCKVEKKMPFKFRITEPAAKMLDNLARHSTFMYRMIFANLRLFSPILKRLTKKQGGELNALVRTTAAFTQMEGSKGMNVIPTQAKMLSNHRIIPGETTESVLNKIRKTVKDEKVNIRMVNGMNPSKVSNTTGKAWNVLKDAISDTWQDAIVSPYLMLACSDSRHYGEISDNVYRFSAMALSNEERGYIHGVDERIPISTIAKTVEFYLRIIKVI